MIEKWFEAGWYLHSLKTTTDATGNPIEAWSTGTPIAGRFRQLSGNRRVASDKHEIFADSKFYCSINSTIAEGDELRKGSLTYTVKFVHNPMDMDRFLQVEAMKK